MFRNIQKYVIDPRNICQILKRNMPARCQMLYLNMLNRKKVSDLAPKMPVWPHCVYTYACMYVSPIYSKITIS